MAIERPGAFTWGTPMTVIGDTLNVGDKAPDFKLVANDFGEVTLADYAGRVRIISAVPSLDTGVCDAQTRRLNEKAGELGEDVVVLTVSAEFPINQRRWCGASGLDHVIVLSDHMDMNFGTAYGTYVKERRAEARSVFVVDRDGIIRYVEYVPVIGQHPDYDAVLKTVKEALGSLPPVLLRTK
ncbi:MAG: thiol peroxidase [Chloroflexota bacterium]|jgi:thiol peroxidase